MLHRLIIPVFFLGAAVLIIKAVDDIKGYDMEYETFCLGLRPGPSVDALFIGSSRLHATIDPIFLEGRTADRTGTPLTSAKIVGAGPDHIAYNIMARQYLEDHEPPRYVVIEAMYSVRKTLEFYGALWDRDMVPYVSVATALVGPAGHYADLTIDKPFNDVSTFFHRDHINVVELLSSRYLTGLYRFLESPRESLTAPHYQCRVRDMPPEEKQRRYAEKLELFETETPRLVTDKTIYMSMWQQAIADEVPRSAGSPARAYENAALKALIDVFRQAGVENIYLVAVPTLGDIISDKEKQTLQGLFPDHDFFFLSDLYEQHPDMARMYADPFHYSHNARMILTDFYADKLLENND